MNRLALPLLLLLLASGCFFDFDRGITLEPGDVAGRAVRGAGGDPAGWAAVNIIGSTAGRRADALGEVVVRDLPAGGWRMGLRDDRNGDGWPERASDRAFAINLVSHAEGLFGQGEPKRTFVLLGDIALDGVVEVRGSVRGTDGGPAVGAIVVAYRRTELPASTLDDAVSREAIEADGPVEATTATDENGEFFFPAIGAGAVTYVAFLDDDPNLLGSVPVTVEATEGDVIDVDDLTLALVALPDTRAVQLELSELPSGPVDVTLVRGGTDPELAAGRDVVRYDAQGPGLSLPLEVPHGLWDVYVEEGGAPLGFAQKQVASRAGDVLQTWGIVQLAARGPCDREDDAGRVIRDCDGDGVQGLPPFDDENDPAFDVWSDCAATCDLAHGTSAGGRVCDRDGEQYDCDDDLDDQADHSEPHCYGPALGPDRDADRLCDFVDPYPQCAQNDPTHPACSANRDPNDWRPPPLDPLFGGPAFDGGPTPPVDAGFDAGPDEDAGFDAGPEDAGADEDAGLDAGPVDAGFDAGPVDAGFDAGFDAGPFDAGPPDPFFVESPSSGSWARGYGDDNFAILDMAANPTPSADPAFVALVQVGADISFGNGCDTTGNLSNPTVAVVAFRPSGVCAWLRNITPVSTGNITRAHVVYQPVWDRFGIVMQGDGPVELDDPMFPAFPGTWAQGADVAATWYWTDGRLGQTRSVTTGADLLRITDAAAKPSGPMVIVGDFQGTLAWDGASSISHQSFALDGFIAELGEFTTASELIDIPVGVSITNMAVGVAPTGDVGVAGWFASNAFAGLTQSFDNSSATLSSETGTNQFFGIYDPNWNLYLTNRINGISETKLHVDGVEANSEVFFGVSGSTTTPVSIYDVDDTVVERTVDQPAVLDSFIVFYGKGSGMPASDVKLVGVGGSATLADFAFAPDGTLLLNGSFDGQVDITPSHGSGGTLTFGLPSDGGALEQAFVARFVQSGFPTLALVQDGSVAVVGESAAEHLVVPASGAPVSAGTHNGAVDFGPLMMPSGRTRFLWVHDDPN